MPAKGGTCQHCGVVVKQNLKKHLETHIDREQRYSTPYSGKRKNVPSPAATPSLPSFQLNVQSPDRKKSRTPLADISRQLNFMNFAVPSTLTTNQVVQTNFEQKPIRNEFIVNSLVKKKITAPTAEEFSIVDVSPV
jgi:hypothetical protein